MSKNGKKRSFGGLLLDFVLVLCTGGFMVDMDFDSLS